MGGLEFGRVRIGVGQFFSLYWCDSANGYLGAGCNQIRDSHIVTRFVVVYLSPFVFFV